MKNEISKKALSIFEQIRQIDDKKNEFWGARQLAKALEYTVLEILWLLFLKPKKLVKTVASQLETISLTSTRWFQLVQEHFEKWIVLNFPATPVT